MYTLYSYTFFVHHLVPNPKVTPDFTSGVVFFSDNPKASPNPKVLLDSLGVPLTTIPLGGGNWLDSGSLCVEA
jgi:hypothetical protein